MDNKKLFKLIDDSPNPLIFDGAMGTMLHNHGKSFEGCLDYLNISDPAVVADIHREYIEAGSQIILTNTFGANRFKLAEHGMEDLLEAINRSGVNLAQKVVEASFKPVLIAGDVGPLGIRLAPFGRVQRDEAQAAFAEQIKVLGDNGVDLILIETIADLYEIQAAIQAAKEVSDLAVIATMTFTRDDRTLLGDPPGKVAKRLMDAGADVIGVNCSEGPSQVLRILRKMKEAVPEAHFLVKPNAGWPERVGGRILYPAGPGYFGDYALAFRQAGADIIGGCCGTTPGHIHAMREAVENTPPEKALELPRLRIVQAAKPQAAPEQGSQLAEKFKAGKFAFAVEMDPPRGHATYKIHAGASLLAEAGADVINVADSPMASMRMSPWAVCDLIQRNVGVETTLHFPTRGRNLLRLQGDLLAAHAIGVRNVFVVMGDPTKIGDYPEAMDNYDLAPSGVVKLIKQGFNHGVDHAGVGIGTPTNFFVGSALNLTPKDPEREIKVLRRKINNGTDFFLTQPVFDPKEAERFLELYREKYGEFDLPILVGILPLYNTRNVEFLHNEVPGIDIPDVIRERMAAAGEDGPKEGVKIAVELIVQIKPWAQGVYLMPPFNRYEIAAEIIEAVR